MATGSGEDYTLTEMEKGGGGEFLSCFNFFFFFSVLSLAL